MRQPSTERQTYLPISGQYKVVRLWTGYWYVFEGESTSTPVAAYETEEAAQRECLRLLGEKKRKGSRNE